MASCLEISTSRLNPIEIVAGRLNAMKISASLVCGLNYDDNIYLVSSEGLYLYSLEDYKLYTKTE